MFGRLARCLSKRGHACQTPDDFVSLLNEFLQLSDFPFEHPSARHCIKVSQTRDWCFCVDLSKIFLIIRCCGVIMLGFGKEVGTSKFELLSSVFTTWCLLDARNSFLAAAVPVRLKGIGGPGAPHIL